MGIRTYYHGLRRGIEITRALQIKKDTSNPYASYEYLLSQMKTQTDLVTRNLQRRVAEGMISLEELVSGGNATKVFQEAGLFDSAVEKLARRQATLLARKAGKLEKFLLSGKASLPYVIEKLASEDIALALCSVSKAVRQRAVRELIEKARFSSGTETRITYQLVYDQQETTTRHFPANIPDVFCFKRKPTRVLGINRGVVLTDVFAANMGEILDALDQSKISPLDHILIWLRGVGGMVYPSIPSLVKDWPTPGREEFIERDHFSREARNVLHQAVAAEYSRMVSEGGEPLSFRVYVLRPKPDLYEIALSWENLVEPRG